MSSRRDTLFLGSTTQTSLLKAKTQGELELRRFKIENKSPWLSYIPTGWTIKLAGLAHITFRPSETGIYAARSHELRVNQTEVAAKLNLHHENIIPVHSVYLHEGACFSITDFNGITLSDLLKTNIKLSDQQLANIVIQIINALIFLQESKIYGLRIEPKYIIITNAGIIQLGDIGGFINSRLAGRLDIKKEILRILHVLFSRVESDDYRISALEFSTQNESQTLKEFIKTLQLADSSIEEVRKSTFLHMASGTRECLQWLVPVVKVSTNIEYYYE